jgi:16S rRNA (guanine527-N7)-methyltransferase
MPHIQAVNSREFHSRLTRRARRAGVTLLPVLAARLEAYYRLLTTWNQKINLTGLNLSDVTPEALDRLLIEPLVAVKHAPTGTSRMIDVGSGGGSPAIPFALAVPDLQLLLVESKTRKSVFLREALRTLGVRNGEVAALRFEELLARPDLHEAHDLLTIRAVRVEAKVLMSLQAFVKPGGQLFLFRGTDGGPPDTITPPLSWLATYPLIDSLHSRLVVLEKRGTRPLPAQRRRPI